MKKRIFCLAIYLFLIIVLTLNIVSSITVVTGESITGETITGKVPSQQTNVSIFVSANVPILSIITPENKTYITNDSLLLHYSATNADAVWYNLDDEDNTTITSYVYFNTSQGSHILNLYANNSQGESNVSVTFAINSEQFTMNYSEWGGESTDFYNYSYEELQNLMDIVLENTDFGKMFFFGETINLTDDYNFGDNEIDIDRYINLSFNRIEIDTFYLNNFNKSATLSLYNLTYTNPRLVMNGQVCPSNICTIDNYNSSSGTLIFNVTHFTTYSAEETPGGGGGNGGGGGGGGGTITEIKEIGLDKEKISLSLKQGETKKQTLTIKNIGKQKIKISLEITKIKDLIKISEESFELNAEDSKTIDLDFIARGDTLPDIYIGKLIVKTDGVEKEILMVIEVESKKPLFDVKVEIPERFLYVLPGEEIMTNIKLFRVEGKGKVDVKLEYIVKNEQNEIILSEGETRAVETEMGFVKAFRMPSNINYGTYIFYVKAVYNGEVASSTAQFSVSKEKPLKKENIILIIIIIFTIILLFILYEMRMLKKHIKAHMKIDENVLVKEKLIKLKNSKR